MTQEGGKFCSSDDLLSTSIVFSSSHIAMWIDPDLYWELDKIQHLHTNNIVVDHEKGFIKYGLTKLCLENNIPFFRI